MSLEISGPEEGANLNILVYGESGVGKTQLAGTAQDYEPTQDVLFIDIEGGTLTLKNKPIDVVTINSFDDMKLIYEWLKEYIYYRDNGNEDGMVEKIEEIGGTTHDSVPTYRTVVVDSLSECQEYALRAIQGVDMAELSSWTDIDSAGLQDWLTNDTVFSHLIRNFRDMNMNVIFTALERELKDERSGSITIGPAMAQGLSRKLPGLLDLVGYMYVGTDEDDEKQRYMLTQPDGRHKAKDRHGALPNPVENPTVEKLLKYIHGEDE